MKKNKHLSLSIFFSIFIISFFDISCDNSTGPVSDVSGVIYNSFHFPLSNVKVSAQGQTVLTSDDGRFNLSGISTPYDLTVSDSSFRSNVDLYKGLNVPYIELEFDKHQGTISYAEINVTLPPEIFQPDVVCKIIYSDKKFTNIYWTVFFPNQIANLQIPVFKDVIKGKVYVLAFKREAIGDRVLSYENYGTSPEIEVQEGDVINYTFTNDQLSFNPGEKDVECIIETNLPNTTSIFNLTFSPKNYFYPNAYFSILTGNNLQIKIPTGIPDAFYPILNYNVGSTAGNFSINPNTSNYINDLNPCEILTPANFSENVDNSTPFSFSTGEGSGVYEIILFNNVSATTYRIFTTENNFTLEWLTGSTTEDFSGDNFTWTVTKKGPFTSVNDFALNYFNTQNTFITRTDNGYFTFE